LHRRWRNFPEAICGAICAISLAWSAHAADAGPVGRWQTIDDDDGKPRSLVVIEEKQGELTGRIVQIYPRPGDDAQNLCEQCAGARKNQPIVGMVFMWGLRKQGDEYSGGEILDPDSGNIYRAKLKLSPDGRQLTVRGYLGISLFGRSQVWLREKQDQADPVHGG
jgi:uncharacterized protein (DUF2147 family)